MHYRYYIFMFAAYTVFSINGMWQQTSGQRTTKKRSRVFFESTATLSFDKRYSTDLLSVYVDPHNINHDALGCSYYKCDGNCYKTLTHPLIAAGIKPYQSGNGGLLNPELQEYSVRSVVTDDGVRVTLKGIVEADGFAPQAFNETHIGQSNNENKAIRHEPLELEELILGALKERAVDRGISDLTDTYFDGGKNQERFEECVKQEWSGSSDDAKTLVSSRCNECAELMRRYCPRTVIWHSNWEKGARKGDMQSKQLYRTFKTSVKIKLDTFEVHVK